MKLIPFSDLIAVNFDLLWNVPVTKTEHGRILLHERINYEIRRWERGGPKPSSAVLVRWARAHGIEFVSPSWFAALYGAP